MTQLLLTSFTTWLPHQKSNAADDLLLELMQTPLPPTVHFLRQLPVDFVLAPQQAIAQIQQLQPNCVICCGMAESRTRLSVESRAVSGDRVLHTCFDLPQLVAELPMTEISHDAGRFVCNTTYYKVLEHLQDSPGRGLFVHVPILTAINREAIVRDFQQLLMRILAAQPQKFTGADSSHLAAQSRTAEP